MTKKFLAFLVIGTFVLSTISAFAGGDQNTNRHRGDKGKGSVVQNQINK